jgi:hypothetical protein
MSDNVSEPLDRARAGRILPEGNVSPYLIVIGGVFRKNSPKVLCVEDWPAPGSEDTELGVLMELEVGHGETEVYPRVQA